VLMNRAGRGLAALTAKREESCVCAYGALRFRESQWLQSIPL
jgi:hypothetical protein